MIIKAFNKLKFPLIIVGDGPERKNLEKIANKNIIFKNKSSDKDVENLLSKCRGFVYSGVEDFGIAPIEALASGAPVIALAKGGILFNHVKLEIYKPKSEDQSLINNSPCRRNHSFKTLWKKKK